MLLHCESHRLFAIRCSRLNHRISTEPRSSTRLPILYLLCDFNPPYMFFAANVHFESVVEYSFRAYRCTCQTENAFGGKYSFTIHDVFHDIDVHRTCLGTRTALGAFFFIPLNFKKGKPGCYL